MRDDVVDALVAGIKSKRAKYDAWSGTGWWYPQAKLGHRDAEVVAEWVEELLDQQRREIAAEIRASKPAPNSILRWESGRDRAARIATTHRPGVVRGTDEGDRR